MASWVKRVSIFSLIFISVCLTAFAEDKWASGEANVRTGPGTNYDIMGRLVKNEKVEVFAVNDGWAQILFENVEGYVSMDLLLSEPIKTPEQIAEEELKKDTQKKERLKSRLLHIAIVIGGILGTIIIVKTF